MGCKCKNNKHYTRIRAYKALLMLTLMVCSGLLFANRQSYNPENPDEWIVVIDAGHGGRDPGTVGKHSKEKDLSLAIALKTGRYIEEKIPGVKIIYTRTNDTFVELYRRAEIANKAKADLFISIHINANKDTRAKGTETYAMGIHKDDGNLQVAMKENAVITLEDDYSTRYLGYDPNSSESFITFSLMQNIYLEQSLNFASYIQNQFRERVGLKDRGVKQAGFIVLWQTTMPSVLVESGFSSNLEEEKFLMSAEGQDFIASAIFRAFRDYKESIDKKSDFSTVAASREVPYVNSNIDFRVQIATAVSRSDLNPVNFKGLKDLSEIISGKYYKYSSGHFKTYREAADYRVVVQNSFPDAFVIAVKNGENIPLQEAIEKTNKD